MRENDMVEKEDIFSPLVFIQVLPVDTPGLMAFIPNAFKNSMVGLFYVEFWQFSCFLSGCTCYIFLFSQSSVSTPNVDFG